MATSVYPGPIPQAAAPSPQAAGAIPRAAGAMSRAAGAMPGVGGAIPQAAGAVPGVGGEEVELRPDGMSVRVRKAKLQDATRIFELVNSLSHDGTLLRRSYAEICENVRDFTVAEEVGGGGFLGCGALHLYGPHLAEVRSIVVRPEAKGRGAGAGLMRALLEEAEEQGVVCVCLFTRIPKFFLHFGFREVDRTMLPDKIYKDCQTCPRLYACDEVAMVVGQVPRIAVLGPPRFPEPELVKLKTGTIRTGR